MSDKKQSISQLYFRLFCLNLILKIQKFFSAAKWLLLFPLFKAHLKSMSKSMNKFPSFMKCLAAAESNSYSKISKIFLKGENNSDILFDISQFSKSLCHYLIFWLTISFQPFVSLFRDNFDLCSC